MQQALESSQIQPPDPTSAGPSGAGTSATLFSSNVISQPHQHASNHAQSRDHRIPVNPLRPSRVFELSTLVFTFLAEAREHQLVTPDESYGVKSLLVRGDLQILQAAHTYAQTKDKEGFIRTLKLCVARTSSQDQTAKGAADSNSPYNQLNSRDADWHTLEGLDLRANTNTTEAQGA